MKRRRGFTLIELMVVILIVALLAAVAIPILRSRIDAAKWSEGKAMMGTIATAMRAYAAEQGMEPALSFCLPLLARLGPGLPRIPRLRPLSGITWRTATPLQNRLQRPLREVRAFVLCRSLIWSIKPPCGGSAGFDMFGLDGDHWC
jgi:prepilin-type N-terminal cleavage/methylation domain-containing protein